jgi:hypothetical protein
LIVGILNFPEWTEPDGSDASLTFAAEESFHGNVDTANTDGSVSEAKRKKIRRRVKLPRILFKTLPKVGKDTPAFIKKTADSTNDCGRCQQTNFPPMKAFSLFNASFFETFR